MEYASVAVPAAPVRRKATHASEMVSQLLFGESVEVLKSKKDWWAKVRSLHDGYEGWVTKTMLVEVSRAEAKAGTRFVSTELLSPVLIGDRKMYIPAGSTLPYFENGKGRFGNIEYGYAGNFFTIADQQPGGDLVRQLSLQWLNAPYLWGGRTPLGVDCSGFVQVIFKQMGLSLPRDAWQQAQEGQVVKKLGEAKAGDLAFFDNREDIVHVGILLGNNEMIHSSGKVRLDTLSNKGIVNDTPRKRPLRLKAIRRLF